MTGTFASPQEAGANRAARLAAAACGLAGLVLFQFFGNATQGYIVTRSLFYWWTFQWANAASETEHGPLVLLIAAGLLWRNLRRAPPVAVGGASRWRRAALLLGGGVLLHAVGFHAQQARLSIGALLLFLSGLGWLAGGRRWGEASAFPLGFLAFAIPVDALDSAGFWLRLWVVRASTAVAHALHLGVLQNGTLLAAPDGRFNYDVAAACSGVRSLLALLALSLLVGYLNFRPAWLRAAIMLLCLPLVYLGNVLRIVAIVVAADRGGQQWGERVHDFMGYGVFAVVLAGLLGAVAALRRRAPAGWLASPDPRQTAPADPPSPADRARAGPVLVAALTLALVLGAIGLARRPPGAGSGARAGVRLAAGGLNPVDLPPYLGIDWTGRPQEVTAAERGILPADTGFSRRLYFNHHDPSRQVFFSVVLSGRDRSSIHRPELCLIGQGWTIHGTSRGLLPAGVPAAPDFAATVLRVAHEQAGARGGVRQPQLVAYWFVDGDGRAVASYWERLWRDGWGRLAAGRADRWAYIVAQTGAEDGDAAALGRLRQVAAQVLPEIMAPPAGTRAVRRD